MNDAPNAFVGQQFGRLTVVADSGLRTKTNNRLWYCRCACGRLTTVSRGNLTRGTTQSCGCLRRERLAIRNRTHHGDVDGTRSAEFIAWEQMLRHGATQTIKVHPTWQAEFLAFQRDVGRRPSPRYALDRYPDPQGAYEPGNVRWATASQRANRRTAQAVLTINGVTKSINAWAHDVAVPYTRILKRLRQGCTAHAAVFAPRAPDVVALLVRGAVSYVVPVRGIGNAGRCVSVPASVMRRLRQEGWHRRAIEVSIARCAPFRATLRCGARDACRIYLPKAVCGHLRLGQRVTVELRG